MNRSLAIPFFGAGAVLTSLFVLAWLPGGPPPTVRPAAVPHAAAASDGGDAKDTGEWADTILARPLFSIGRKPPKVAGGPQIVATNGMPRLSGIMITPYGRRAIFAPDGGKPLVLAEGAVLEDGTIRSIKADRVLVSGPKGDLVLRLSFDHSKSASPLVPNGPAFPQPGLNPGFPNPGFNPAFPGQPNFGVPQQTMPQTVPPAPVPDTADSGDDANAPDTPAQPQPAQTAPVIQPPFPGQRGPMIPRERQE